MYPIYSFYDPGEPGPAALYREQLAKERRASSKKAKQPQQKNEMAESLRGKYFLAAARFMRMA
jgi:hypothetical protein